MTKELESLLNELNIQNYNLYSALFDELTINNVCIPKGETLQVNFAGGWEDVITINHHREYRIKLSEPIYEWQWYDIDRNMEVFIVNRGHFMTEDECGELTTFGQMRKFEETKRERK